MVIIYAVYVDFYTHYIYYLEFWGAQKEARNVNIATPFLHNNMNNLFPS